MNPEERARRKKDREEADRKRSRQAARKGVAEALEERGHIPDQLLRDVVLPALVEGAQRANRSTRKGA